MKIFNYEIHRKKQLDILENKKPIICIHKHGVNKKEEKFCKRILVVYGEKFSTICLPKSCPICSTSFLFIKTYEDKTGRYYCKDCGHNFA